VLIMLEVSNCSPEMAVPMTVKMPEPMTAPMPSAVSDHGPRVFFSACSGSSESRISLSIDLRATSWLGRAVLLFQVSTGPSNPVPFKRDWSEAGIACQGEVQPGLRTPKGEQLGPEGLMRWG